MWSELHKHLRLPSYPGAPEDRHPGWHFGPHLNFYFPKQN